MPTARCARLIAVGIANELHEIMMASQEFLIFVFLGLNCRWLVQRSVIIIISCVRIGGLFQHLVWFC